MDDATDGPESKSAAALEALATSVARHSLLLGETMANLYGQLVESEAAVAQAMAQLEQLLERARQPPLFP